MAHAMTTVMAQSNSSILYTTLSALITPQYMLASFKKDLKLLACH